MKPYEALADDGRRVVCYDQLGCGSSSIEAPHDVRMFTPELYVREIDTLRDALGLDRLIVLGHSWGGMLAMAYAITRPTGLAGIVVQSSPASVPFWNIELDRLRSQLPRDVEARLRAHEASGTTDSAEYEEAVQVFYDRFLCRVPHPEWLQECFRQMEADPEVYRHMNGPSEFHVIGTLRDWDIEGELGAIDVPTLLFCGRHDEVTPATMQRVHDRIPGSEFVVLEGSSHMAQAEEPERTLELIRGFLDRVERG
jgi:proline-specific peptidase